VTFGIVVVVGPTAVGKSALVLQLAREFGGEIVTADSRQVYRYLDIGTAKPDAAERALVPHRMIDLVEPTEVYTAALYREEGQRVLARLEAEDRPAFVAGGTGFYVRALLDGLRLPDVAPDPDLRARLYEEARNQGPRVPWLRLRALDPDSAARVHPNNLSRVVRALEIVENLGSAVPTLSAEPGRPALHIGLSMERSHLHSVADARVLAQVDAGLVEETRLLLAMGYDRSSPALDGFGYRQMVAFLDGNAGLEEAIADYQLATRRYIRRQLTWFRRDSRIQWFDAEGTPVDQISSLVRAWLDTRAGH
jgi:tRNA dimethylallyltransferase